MQPERFPLTKIFDAPFLSLDGTSAEMASLLFLFLAVAVAASLHRRRQVLRRVVQGVSVVVFFYIVYSCLGVFGMVRNSLYGLTLETGILFIPAVLYLVYADLSGTGAFLHSNLTTNILLIGAGAVTTIPLLMFASAAQRLPLSMVGIMQYIAPTIQFLLGVLVYKEPFDHTHLIGFGIVWVALILFAAENFWARRSIIPVEPIPELGEG